MNVRGSRMSWKGKVSVGDDLTMVLKYDSLKEKNPANPLTNQPTNQPNETFKLKTRPNSSFWLILLIFFKETFKTFR